MKIAIVGSRNITLSESEISEFISKGDEIISGGAMGVDHSAAEYANKFGLKLTEILPRYETYGRAAPIIRNREIVDSADKIIVFWDGKSKGSLSVIKYAEKRSKECQVILK